MAAATDIDPSRLSTDLRRFLDSVPDADGIRDRLDHLEYEKKFLYRLLRLSIAAEKARKKGASRG